MQAMKDLPDTESEERIDRAVCRAILYDVLAMSLRPPTPDMLSRLGEEGASETVVDAALALDDAPSGPPLCAAVKRLFEALRGSRLDLLEDSYRSIFGHTAHGQVPPYETEYGSADVFRQAQELADIGGFYRAFGLEMARACHERNDHIVAELEFLSLLATKEAYDVVDGDLEGSEAVRRAERLFLREHAAGFGRAFGRSLARSGGHAVYRAAGELCFDFLTSECARFDVPPGQARPPSPIRSGSSPSSVTSSITSPTWLIPPSATSR
jgi:TorA maturation chaperone TorD